MADTKACPPKELLESFVLGQLTPADVESMPLADLSGPELRERAALKAGGALVAFASNNTSLVTCHMAGVLRLWDLSGAEPQELLKPESHTGPLGGVVLTPDGTAYILRSGPEQPPAGK
jgi:WD40 repeat protein